MFTTVSYPISPSTLFRSKKPLKISKYYYDKNGVNEMIENLSQDVFETILNTLPVEISFADENDVVRYFNKNGDRIFPRSRSVIGRRVQDCHPKKSVHVVDRLLDEMKDNRRDVAEFWIDLKGRTIYIRYFAVRDSDGEYLGCLEVTQDITEIKNIEGEKRLLDIT